MPQLCLWTKFRTKHWLVLSAPAFQCVRAGFLYLKCDNFACLHTRQDQNELHLKRWFFFFAKIGIFCKLIAVPLPSVVQGYTQPYSFDGRIKLIICQIRHELVGKKNVKWRTLYKETSISLTIGNFKLSKEHDFHIARIGTWAVQCIPFSCKF